MQRRTLGKPESSHTRKKNSPVSLRKRRATAHQNTDGTAVELFKEPSAAEMDQAMEIVRFLRQVRDAGLRNDQLLERLQRSHLLDDKKKSR